MVAPGARIEASTVRSLLFDRAVVMIEGTLSAAIMFELLVYLFERKISDYNDFASLLEPSTSVEFSSYTNSHRQ